MQKRLSNTTTVLWVSEWLLFDAKLAIFTFSVARTSYVRWDNDDVLFVLHQHVISDYYSASSLKQQLVGKSDNTMAKEISIKQEFWEYCT